MTDRQEQAQPRLVRAEPDYFCELDESEPLRNRAVPVVQHYWQVAKNKWLIAAILLLALLVGTLSYLPRPRDTKRAAALNQPGREQRHRGDEVQVEDTLRDNQYFETQYERFGPFPGRTGRARRGLGR